MFRDAPRLRIVVGGGDGTVASTLNYLTACDVQAWSTHKNPPVAVLPLGTGNDLSRSLGWGGGAASPQVSLLKFLEFFFHYKNKNFNRKYRNICRE
jgi:diacylglycerol kinase (ATP)